jgi:hypothetical protein
MFSNYVLAIDGGKWAGKGGHREEIYIFEDSERVLWDTIK